VYTSAERERIRAEILDAARNDPRITGGAITGSASQDREDAWSDIDLAFGLRAGAPLLDVVEDWTARMRERYGALHTVDVTGPLDTSYVGGIEASEIARAFAIVTDALLREAAIADAALAERLRAPLREMSS